MKIEEKDVGLKINFLGYEEAKIYFNDECMNWICHIKINDIEKQLSILNKENNIKIYVNNKIESKIFKSYFLPIKHGIYTIKLNFNIKLECCIGKFYGRSKIIDINLSNFKTQNINLLIHQMLKVFHPFYDLSSFNTENVENMIQMFYRCKSLKH